MEVLYHGQYIIIGVELKTHSNIIAGCTQLSKNPSRNRTVMSAGNLVEAAEQATMTPQMKTLTDSILARGSFCRRKFIGYSPQRIPIYRIVPSHWYYHANQYCRIPYP